MIDTARAEPVLIEKHGRGVVVVVSMERLSVQSGHTEEGEPRPRGASEGANEAFSRVKIDQPLKDVDWSLMDSRSVRFEYPRDDSDKVAYALFNRQGRALAALGTKRTSVNPGVGERGKCASSSGNAR